MKFFIILILFYCHRYLKSFFVLLPKKLNTYKHSKTYANKKSSGYDERQLESNLTEIQTQLYNLRRIFEKKRMLDILQNENVNMNHKLDLLTDNSITAPNIRAGGLMDDFESADKL